MREIKFRAWDKKLKKYINPETIVIDPLNGIVIETAGFDMMGNYDDVVLEQYTGLKDKNSVEIYENDIVRIPLNEAAYSNNTVAVVSYDKNSMLLAGRLVLSRIYTAVEVVGNIHENADLLSDDIGNDIHEFLHRGDK